MFRIFSKSRKDLVNGSKVRKYLAYATGEIVLVVVGILIALQFNDADLDRQDRKKEREFMVSLVSDLETDVANIDIALEGNGILLDGLNELLTRIATLPVSAEEKRSLYLLSLKNTYWYLTAEFSEGTFSQLKYSGGFQLIRNDEVVEAILRYDQVIAGCRHQYEEMVHYFHVVEARQKMLQAYYGDVLFYRTVISVTNSLLARQKELAASLSRLIRERYGTGK